MSKSEKLISIVALAAALGMMSDVANAGLVASFSPLGTPAVLPAGATSVVDFGALPLGAYNGGAVYNTGGGTTTGVTNPASYVAAPWTSSPIAYPPGSGYAGNFFAENDGDTSTWTFATGQHTFYMYIGSLDFGNSLTITASDGTTVFTGLNWLSIFGALEPGDGIPTVRGCCSNGWFTFTDTTGTISSLTTAEGGRVVGNSFEIAAIATSSAVPEPSTWAMLLLAGFGGLGLAGLRRSRKTAVSIA